MTAHDRSKVLDLYAHLRRATEETLFAFADQGSITYQARSGLPYAACVALCQYARCRGWALYYRRWQKPTLARREAALAGRQTRYFRRL